jgi:hypothetical protein
MKNVTGARSGTPATSRVVAALAVLASAVGAMANLRVFVTPAAAGYGLTPLTADNMYIPTFGGYDYTNGGPAGAPEYNGFRLGSVPPADYPSGTAGQPTVSAANDFYIWAQFQDIPLATDLGVNGITITITGGSLLNVAYYLMDNHLSSPAFKRWDGSVTPGAPELKQNPQSLVAVTGGGIWKVNGDVEPNVNMQKWQASLPTEAQTSITLLGAVKIPEGHVYQIQITNIGYQSTTTPLGAPAYFKALPEPASLLLVGLAALLLRRRT